MKILLKVNIFIVQFFKSIILLLMKVIAEQTLILPILGCRYFKNLLQHDFA